MGSKYVILFNPKIEGDARELEKRVKEAVAVLLPSNIKKDQQAVRMWRKKKDELKPRAKDPSQIRLCKILR